MAVTHCTARTTSIGTKSGSSRISVNGHTGSFLRIGPRWLAWTHVIAPIPPVPHQNGEFGQDIRHNCALLDVYSARRDTAPTAFETAPTEETLKKSTIMKAGVSLLLACGSCQLAIAATWCVNSGGASGCASSIGAAISAASAGDTISVAHGIYKEQVSIGKPLFLIGQSASNTVIDATGKINGITITNTSQVVVTGFTVENADAAGIWITRSSFVTISQKQRDPE